MIELLAPAGSYESLVAGVNAGADAVYIGGTKFSARAYADNPGEDMLIKGIEYAHTFGVNVYMTINTLLKENEIKELFEYIKTYYLAGIDAVIVQDLGVFEFIRKYFPLLPVHASTQMTVTGSFGAIFLKNQGAYRVVPARELSLEEIRSIDKASDIEIECFVHGALCYAYSGQCLMSSLIGGRSGNRGRCAQTCRLPYDLYEGDKKLNKNNEKNLLSCKDLCSLDILPDLAQAGIDSLKIEGRMKTPRYTAGVVSIWRKYLDRYLKKGRQGYTVEKSDRKLLLDLFDRGGQTEGYYKEHNGKDMIALYEKPEKKDVNAEYFEYLDKNFVESKRKLEIFGEISIKDGEPMRLRVRTKKLNKVYGEGREDEDFIEVEAFGEPPQRANSKPSVSEDIKKQINKTGNTLFAFKDIKIDMDDNLFVQVKILNELRRDALEKLNIKILERYKRDEKNIKIPENIKIEDSNINRGEFRAKFNILCETEEQLRTCVKFAKERNFIFDEVSIESELLEIKELKVLLNQIREYSKSLNLYMPHIFRTHAKKFFDLKSELIKNCNFDNFIIRSLEELFYIKENICENPSIIFDYNIYAYNKNTIDFYKKTFKIKRLTYPLELNLAEIKQLNNMGNEMLVYGKLPMMVSAQCLKKTAKGCDHKKEVLKLKDRKNSIMEVKTHCDFCYNTILNSKPLSVLGMEKDIKKISPGILRVWFTTEDGNDVWEILEKYIESFCNERDISNIKDFTRGHLKRGIE